MDSKAPTGITIKAQSIDRNESDELSLRQREEQRVQIGVRARSILSQFWRDTGVHDAEQALELEGWLDVLDGCSPSEVRKAWAEYQRTGPRTAAGKLYKPDAGALWRIITRPARQPRNIAQTRPETAAEKEAYIASMARDKIDPEKAARSAEIIKAAGFSLKVVTNG